MSFFKKILDILPSKDEIPTETANPYEKMRMDERVLLSEIQKYEEENEFVIKKYHRQWFFQIAMRIGAQWMKHNPEGLAIVPERTNGRTRIIVNRILSAHQTKLAKLIKTDPWLEISEDKHSYRSKRQARKGNRLLEYVYREQGMKKKLKTLATWSLDIGTGFLYPWWDWSLGEDIIQYQQHSGPLTGLEPYNVDNQGFILDENGEKKEASREKTGDVRIDFVSAFDIVPSGIRPDGTAKRVIMHCKHDVEDAKLMFPEIADDIKEGDSNSKSKASENVDYYKQIIGLISNDTSHYGKNLTEKGVIISQFFEEPTTQYPEGRHVIWLCGKIAKADKLPYQHMKMPIIRFGDIENSGQFFHMATIQNMIPVQKAYNKSWCQLIENAEIHANIKWKVEGDGDIEADALDDTAEEVVRVPEGTKIDQISPASLPNYFVQMLINLYPQAFEDTSGQHEVTNAEAPSGIKSGVALDSLQAQDDTRHVPAQIDFNSSLEDLGEQVISLYEEFVQDKRKFKIKGTGREVDIEPNDLKDLWKNIRVTLGFLNHFLEYEEGTTRDTLGQ